MKLTGPALNLRPRYNVAPGQDVAAVRTAEGGRGLSMLRWGLFPADRVYEWERKGKVRQLWYFGLNDGGLMVFAGLCVTGSVAGESLADPEVVGRTRLQAAKALLDEGQPGIASRVGSRSPRKFADHSSCHWMPRRASFSARVNRSRSARESMPCAIRMASPRDTVPSATVSCRFATVVPSTVLTGNLTMPAIIAYRSHIETLHNGLEATGLR